MTEAQLVALFRHTLRASLAIPLLAGAIHCGGRTVGIGTEPQPDAGSPCGDQQCPDATPDARTCESQTCAECALGCTAVGTCVEGRLDCGCDCTHPVVDGGHHDAGQCLPTPCPSCGPNCTEENSCIDNQFVCSCACGEPVDAGGPDSSSFDASDGDSGPVDPCNPPVENCGAVAVIPLSCFDALPIIPDGGGFSAQCKAYCPQGGYSYECSLVAATSTSPGGLECQPLCVGGRAFEGMQTPVQAGEPSPLARYFAEAAHLEAAAVDAFRILRDELAAHGAPTDLVVAAARAADDETRHARMTRKLAKRFGGIPARSRAGKRTVRPLLAVAIENAVEGCVRETFAALLAHHQASAAMDAKVRATMASIAPDETRHAALSWQVAAWADSLLDEGGRAAVRAAREEAVRALRESVANAVPVSIREVAGVPDAARAMLMVGELEATLWS